MRCSVKTRLKDRRGRGIRRPRSGFALVATLTLLMLLGLIAVGLLAVSSSQNRIAAQTILQAAARQQALIGLDAAISDLQTEAGPDQRVTASSGILSESKSDPQYVLGVWDSWQAPLYGQYKGGNIQGTYVKGRSNMFRRWLISCKDVKLQQQFGSLRDICTKKPGSRICMVGEGTLGPDASKDEYVYAELITMPSSERNETCYAWWIGGENQKANVAIADQPRTTDPVEILHRTWDTPAPVFKDSKSLNFLPTEIPEPQKIVDLKSLPLVNNQGGSEVGQPYFFDATTYSYSLITNPRDGGLKLDLNLLLNKNEKDFNASPMAPRSAQDCPLAEGEGLPTGTEAVFPIGSWQVMHAYYNMWPDGTARDDDFASKRLVGDVRTSHARMVGDLVSATKKNGAGTSYDVTYYSDRVQSNSDSAGYGCVPLLLSFVARYGIAVTKPQLTWGNLWNGDGSQMEHEYWQGTYGLAIAYAPMALWWNPYNVQMRVSPKKLWMFTLPYRTSNVSYQTVGTGDTRWLRFMMLQPTDVGGYAIDGVSWIGQRHSFGNDWGNYLVYSKDDQQREIVFEPGEILMFTMAEGFDNMNAERNYVEQGINPGEGRDDKRWSFSQPQAIPFVQGDQVGYLHNYFISVFSSHEYPNNFTGKYSVKVAFETQDGYDSTSRDNTQEYYETYAGSLSGGKYKHDTVGEDLGPASREQFTMPYGYNGVDTLKVERIVQTSTIKEVRPTATVNSYPGAGGISPFNFSLGWFDYDTTPINDLTFMGGANQEQPMFRVDMYGTDGKEDPEYYAAVGVAPKSYNPMLLDALPAFENKDYRTRNWVHSNPAMGGGALYKPDDQQRQYHPFQLVAYKLSDRNAMDLVNSKNGIYGIQGVGVGGGEDVSFISVLELPMHPPFSLAGFAGMRLKPGWYGNDEYTDKNSVSQMRRMQYQAGVPGVGIGNSFADPCLPSDGVYAFHQTKISDELSSNATVFSDFYDHGFIINDALWDRWFCSSVSDMPGARGRVEAKDTLDAFVNGEQALPVSRYKLARSSIPQDQVVSRIMSGDGWKEIARYLMVEGGFNVNSVSEDAWAAVLQGLAKRELVSNTDNHLHAVEHPGGDSVLFSRFMVSTADRTLDGSGGGFNMLLGAAFLRPSMKMATAWGDVRSLSSDQIRQLAREMVKKVRERGPFLNMADFINRRLDGGTDAALTGALQAAIDATDINKDLMRPDFMVQHLEGDFYSFPRAEDGSMYTAAPGYLIQSDVLMSLGNILTVRDDTFTVRAYGCVRNSRRAILAQAWCEAVVQRTIEYVDPTNDPTDGGYDPANSGADNRRNLTEINRLMGRKMRIVSFKWLDSWDI